MFTKNNNPPSPNEVDNYKEKVNKLIHMKMIKGTLFDKQRGLKLNSTKIISVVTGGSQGLGLELVKLLKELGCTVIIVDILKPEEKVLDCKNVFYYKCDISNIIEVQKLRLKIRIKNGLVSLLINNAGVTNVACLKDMTNEDIDKVMKINLWGTYLITSLFLDDFLLQKQGFIVNIASILGCITPARLSTYGASKGGQITFHKCLNKFFEEINDLGGKQLGTLLVCTGKINTSMFREVETPTHILAPDISPSTLAQKIIEAIQTGECYNLKAPYYTNLIEVMNKLAWPYKSMIKNLSGMNNSTAIGN